MNKQKKIRNLVVISLVLIAVLGGIILVMKPNDLKESMTEQEFRDLEDKEMEIVDTSVFLDKKLEDWYFGNRKEAGEYIYHSGDSTYILVSVGEVEDKNTFLLLNGVKEIKNRLVISYETIQMQDAPEIEFEDNIRSTLIKVEGKYEKVETVDISES